MFLLMIFMRGIPSFANPDDMKKQWREPGLRFRFFFSEHSNALFFCPLHHLDRHPCHPILVVMRLLGGVYNHRMWTTKKDNGGKVVRFFTTKLFSLLWEKSPQESLNRSLQVKHVSLVDSSIGKPKETGPWFTVELDDVIPLYYNYPV